MFASSSSSSSSQSALIFQLDFHLRKVLQQPNRRDLEEVFLHLRRCHDERFNDDQLYVPAILLLRQFPKFTEPQLFDQLLDEFTRFFPVVPIGSKKILDDFLCLISLILSKKILPSHDEVQQNLFLRFFRAFVQSARSDEKFFFDEFLGDFNRNLPVLGHYVSCFLQIFERVTSLDCRLNVLETFSTLVETKNVERQKVVGQILACFLPGILKTLAQDLGSVHQRLVQANLRFLSFVVRVAAQRSEKFSGEIKVELRDLLVERNENWLSVVDSHLVPILQRFSSDYLHHESVFVRRALGIFMLNVLCFASPLLKLAGRTALKTLFMIVAKKKLEPEEKIVEVLLEKLFQSSGETIEEAEILDAPTLKIPEEILRQCQTDFFALLNDEQQRSLSFTDRRARLELFIGYYRFIARQIDDLFIMESFTTKFFDFLLKNLDFRLLAQTHLHLLNHRSSNQLDGRPFDAIEYLSIYKHFRPDVDEQIDELMKFYLRSNETFLDFLFERLNRRSIGDETNQKIFYLISIVFAKRRFDRDDDYQILLTLLTELIADDDKQQRRTTKRTKRNAPPISARNLTIFFLLQTLRTITRPDHREYLLGYLPLLLLCHSSQFTILHQTSLFALTNFDVDLPTFLRDQAEHVVDRALSKLRTSSFDGYLMLIEFVRLGRTAVINLPIMTHVIEELLLELAALPSVEAIRLTFEFLSLFCEQVTDIVDQTTAKKKTKPSVDVSSGVDFALALQNEFHPVATNEEMIEDEPTKDKHPWHEMLVSIVDVFQHFISSADLHVRSYVLDAFPALGRVLSTIDENLFLPLVHKIWPGLVQRFHDADFNIRIRCLTTLECLCQLCSEFIDRRIQQDLLPVLIQQLERYRSVSSSHSLEYRYVKNFLGKLGPILNVITIQFDQIEEIILNLFLYLQNELFAPLAAEQLKILSGKYADEIWLKLVLHDENEFRQGYFPQMKVYKAQPRLSIEPKWKSTLISCLNRC